MVRGQIIITLSNGRVISYANRYLTKKAGLDENGEPLTDNAGTKEVFDSFGNPIMVEKNGEMVPLVEDISTPLFDGYPEFNYYYTGYGNDRYEDQKGLGKIKGDYEYLVAQLGVVGNDCLRFPEADEEHGDTTELVRRVTSTVNGVETYAREQVSAKEVVSIKIKEDWVNFPYGRESGYNLSKNSPNFMGFRESYEIKQKKLDRGPDFNKNIKFDNGYIPNPIIENGIVVNEKEFDEVVVENVKNGKEYYGIKNGKKSGKTFVKN